tara:strand:+ start:873 stop:1523 length:651 start_codon:yes stop_codon:yes gene_type:complete
MAINGSGIFRKIAEGTKQTIQFISVSSGNEVTFPAFITRFSDDYTVSWGSTTSFGRTDPVKNYQSTGRRISTSFDILGENEEQAIENFKNFSALVQMLYPVYSDPIGTNAKARTIKGIPLLRIKYANYIQSPQGAPLLGCIFGFSFNPKFESGHFLNAGNMIPVNYSLNFSFEPLHEQTLGHDASGAPSLFNNFPYSVNFAEPGEPVPAGNAGEDG